MLEPGAAQGVMNDTPEEQLRANVYGLLARLLAAAPDEEVLARLQQIEAEADAQGMAGAWHMLKLAAANSTVEALDDEYHALFIGVGRGELVPFGSWYMTGFLMDKPLTYLRQDLAEFGIARQDGVREPEDHVAALCETMAIIIGHEEEIDFARQQAFYKNHMQPWMRLFFEDLENAQAATFYKAVARLGKEMMDFESRYLAIPA
ncbi:MAG: molecular chaperone TorD family protein [Gammaproteobacteria bacterium]|nr:molecular chaperone TorD family protein [Gammaproteobacteria bacterium]